jgi:hypothetical protein
VSEISQYVPVKIPYFFFLSVSRNDKFYHNRISLFPKFNFIPNAALDLEEEKGGELLK